MDWFLYYRDLRHERVKRNSSKCFDDLVDVFNRVFTNKNGWFTSVVYKIELLYEKQSQSKISNILCLHSMRKQKLPLQ